MALTNAQYDEIMRGYEQRQTENRHRLELRTKEIYEKEPRLTLLDDEISSTSVSSARLLLSGDEAESQKLRERAYPFAKGKIRSDRIPRISEGLSRTDLYLCRLQGYRIYRQRTLPLL